MSVRVDVQRPVSGARLKSRTTPFAKRATPSDAMQESERVIEEMAEMELVAVASPDFMHSLSCIEEEGNESPGSGSQCEAQGSPVSSPQRHVELSDEPLDEKLFRLQSRVISMLEMQKQRSEEPQKRRKPHAVGRMPPTDHLKRPANHETPTVASGEREGHSRVAKNGHREVKENDGEMESAMSDWRTMPGGAVQHRKNLAKHYKEQLELLEHEEKELQHQMNLRQQLKVVLHDEAQQCERACLEPESELSAQQANEKEANEQLVEENRQLEMLRRQLEEQLRISEERRLQLERENQMLQQPVNGSLAEIRETPLRHGRGGLPGGLPGGRGDRGPGVSRTAASQGSQGSQKPVTSLRTKSPSPRRVAYSPPRPRVTSPQRAWQSATKQARQCAPPTSSNDGRVTQVAAPRSVPKFQHPRPARVPQRVSPPKPTDGGESSIGLRRDARDAMDARDVRDTRPKVTVLSPGSTPEDDMPFPDGSHGCYSARLPSPTRETPSGASSSPQPTVEGLHEIPLLPLPLSYREVKTAEHRPPVAIPSNVLACETPSWAAVQHTYAVQSAGPEEVSRASLECQKAGPPRRLGPGRGLVWPTLDLTWGEAPCSGMPMHMPISPNIIHQGMPPSPWPAETEGPSSHAQEATAFSDERNERGQPSSRPVRSLARSSSAANCGRVSPHKEAERRASPSTGRGSSPSSLIRSSSTPLVGQSRRPIAVKASRDARGREDFAASKRA